MELLLSRPPNQSLHRCQVEPDRGLMDIGAPLGATLTVLPGMPVLESNGRERLRFCG